MAAHLVYQQTDDRIFKFVYYDYCVEFEVAPTMVIRNHSKEGWNYYRSHDTIEYVPGTLTTKAIHDLFGFIGPTIIGSSMRALEDFKGPARLPAPPAAVGAIPARNDAGNGGVAQPPMAPAEETPAL